MGPLSLPFLLCLAAEGVAALERGARLARWPSRRNREGRRIKSFCQHDERRNSLVEKSFGHIEQESHDKNGPQRRSALIFSNQDQGKGRRIPPRRPFSS